MGMVLPLWMSEMECYSRDPWLRGHASNRYSWGKRQDLTLLPPGPRIQQVLVGQKARPDPCPHHFNDLDDRSGLGHVLP
jgi:hypothetical protein